MSYNMQYQQQLMGDDDNIPKPWTKGIDQNGQAYYVNTETGQIRRQPPITAGYDTYQKTNAFIDPEQWDLVIETMASTIHPQQQLRIFQKLKKIAEKMITKDDPKYRTLYLNNPKLQHTVLAFDGGLEFLYNLGFEPHSMARDKLICHSVNSRVVQACLICLEDKIEVLSYDVTYNDINTSLNNNNNNNNNVKKPKKRSVSDNDQMDNAHQLYLQQQQYIQQQQQQIQQQQFMQQQQQQHQMQKVQQMQMQQQYIQQQVQPVPPIMNGNHSPHKPNNNAIQNIPNLPMDNNANSGNNNNDGRNQVMKNLEQMGFKKMLKDKNMKNGKKKDKNKKKSVKKHAKSVANKDQYNNNNNVNSNSNMNKSLNVNHMALPDMNVMNRSMSDNHLNNNAVKSKLIDNTIIKNNIDDNLSKNNKLHKVLDINQLQKQKVLDNISVSNQSKTYKTFIFIRHGNSIWNRFKNSGRKKKIAAVAVGIAEYLRSKNNPGIHKDMWVVDAPLSRVGIDEAYGLSRFLNRHLTLRQFESLSDLEHHQSLATPIKDALRIIQTDILDKYSATLKDISPDLLNKCHSIKNTLDTAHRKIQKIMLELESKRGAGGQPQLIHKHKKHNVYGVGITQSMVTKGGPNDPDFMQKRKKSGGSSSSNGSSGNMNGSGKKKKSSLSQSPVIVKNLNPLLVDNKSDDMKSNSLDVKPVIERAYSHVVLVEQVENDNIQDRDDLEMPLEMEWVLDQMVDPSNNSIVVTSNLRRAISTAVISLWDRFAATNEFIHILPCLQEIGMHVDTHTPILERQIPELSNFEKTSKKLNVSKLTEFYRNRLFVEGHGIGAKKSLRENSSDTQQRLSFFCDWAFKKTNVITGTPYHTIIACGHSHWFRAFFKSFLNKNSNAMPIKRKFQNCAVVGFRMICHSGPYNHKRYEIVERSITPIYRGFV